MRLLEPRTPCLCPAAWPARFAAKVDVRGPNECWPWLAGHNGLGYGRFKVAGRLAYAHRLAYGWTHSGVPAGLHVRHECDNPPCCNPAHLVPGTAKQNARDAKDRGRLPDRRLTANRGADCHNAILTEADVRAIRADPRLLREIAAAYGISVPTACAVRTRKRWRHLAD